MSRKYNVRHNRAQSRYPQRLAARGLRSTDVLMDPLEELRRPHRVKIQNAASAWDAEKLMDDAALQESYPEAFRTVTPESGA